MNLPKVGWAPSQNQNWLATTDSQFNSFTLSQVPQRDPSEWEPSVSRPAPFPQPVPPKRPKDKQKRRPPPQRTSSASSLALHFGKPGNSLLPCIAAVSRQCDVRASLGRAKSLPALEFADQPSPSLALKGKGRDHPSLTPSDSSASPTSGPEEFWSSSSRKNSASDNTPLSSMDEFPMMQLDEAHNSPSLSAKRMPPPLVPKTKSTSSIFSPASSKSKHKPLNPHTIDDETITRPPKRALTSPQTSPSRAPPAAKKTLRVRENAIESQEEEQDLDVSMDHPSKSNRSKGKEKIRLTSDKSRPATATSSHLSLKSAPKPKPQPPPPPDLSSHEPHPPSACIPVQQRTLGMRRPTQYAPGGGGGRGKQFKSPFINDGLDLQEVETEEEDHPQSNSTPPPQTINETTEPDEDDYFAEMDSFDMDELESVLKQYD